MGGSAAIQSRPAARATALFTPEARPASESGAEFIALAVRGGMSDARPRPNSTVMTVTGTSAEPAATGL